jgi:penicillin amidase
MDVVSGASWRMIVDLSTSPPTARGIFPGGQSGDPLSEFYETGLGSYLRFDYYDLRMTGSAGELGGRLLQLEPWESGDAGS